MCGAAWICKPRSLTYGFASWEAVEAMAYDDRRYNPFAADITSLGLTLFCLLTGGMIVPQTAYASKDRIDNMIVTFQSEEVSSEA